LAYVTLISWLIAILAENLTSFQMDGQLKRLALRDEQHIFTGMN
jgi:hypothetical protein